MDIRLISDLIHQWMDVMRLKKEMQLGLPNKFHKNWKTLPWKRYQTFYGVLVPVIIHNALFQLHQTPITKKLRKTVSAQALVTGLFDDLFDRLHLSPDRIRALMQSPDQIIPSDKIEEYLCQYLFREMYQQFSGNQNLLQISIGGIMEAQELSSQQLQHFIPFNPKPDISIVDILHITKEKGAKAVLFYRSCIEETISEEENAFLSELGGLFQMTNDINDALKDHHADENTFMTMGLSLREIREIFDAQIRQTFTSWKLLTNDRYHNKGFFSRINILMARSLVTLDRYGRFVDPVKPFDIGKIPRNKVISGLRIPLELRSWYRQYNSMNDISKMPFV